MTLVAIRALAIGLWGGAASVFVRSGFGAVPLAITLLEAPGLDRALSGIASGETIALTVITSLANADDAFCRKFEFDGATGGTIVSVACHDYTSWRTKLAVVASLPDNTS